MIDKLIEQQETIKGMQQNEDSAIKIMKMYEDYKLRVDKAIDYIINHSDASGSFDGEVFYVERIENIKNGTKLLYILKGDDKE